jgi:hypothetical protein
MARNMKRMLAGRRAVARIDMGDDAVPKVINHPPRLPIKPRPRAILKIRPSWGVSFDIKLT